MKLKKVDNSDIKFLYDMLSERDDDINISFVMPTFEQHEDFVINNHYEAWYIIKVGETSIGNVYLTSQNEIGIFIKKEYQGVGYSKKAIAILMEKHPKKSYIANINPRNIKSISLFTSLNFTFVSETYKLEM